MSKLLFYQKEHNIQNQLYETIVDELDKFMLKSLKYVNNKNKKQKNVIKLLKVMKFIMDTHSDRCAAILQYLGITNILPNVDFLEYMNKLVSDNNIEVVIDYKSGTGFWSRIIYDYVGVDVLSYDKFVPFDNVDVNRQRGYYNVVTEINMGEHVNSILILANIDEISIVNQFAGKYVVCCGAQIIHEKLRFVMKFESLFEFDEEIIDKKICIYEKIDI